MTSSEERTSAEAEIHRQLCLKRAFKESITVDLFESRWWIASSPILRKNDAGFGMLRKRKPI